MQSGSTNNLLQKIKIVRPLILNVTNEVTMDFVANGLLSLGASPIMIKAKNEAEELIKLADGVVINIGTLCDESIELANQACKIATQLEKPLILDPVGAGASQYRTETCLTLIDNYQFAVIRGNASEIMALCDLNGTTKGVDASINGTEIIESAKYFSKNHDVVLAISGETDVIIQDQRVKLIHGGSKLMPLITGTGCLLTSVVCAFHAVEADRYLATYAAVNFYNACGEHAAIKASGPGSFRMHFLDALAIPHGKE